MSERGRRFIEGWVDENVHATGYEPEGDNSEARQLAKLCLAEAKAKGISRKEIEEHVGDINDYMSEAIENANDEEVRRLASKD
jgi:hypothetical protein